MAKKKEDALKLWRELRPGEKRRLGDQMLSVDSAGKSVWRDLTEMDLGVQQTDGHCLLPVRRQLNSREKLLMEYDELLAVCGRLVKIVEGPQSVLWRYQGMWLKDTSEWQNFYTSVMAEQRRARDRRRRFTSKP